MLVCVCVTHTRRCATVFCQLLSKQLKCVCCFVLLCFIDPKVRLLYIKHCQVFLNPQCFYMCTQYFFITVFLLKKTFHSVVRVIIKNNADIDLLTVFWSTKMYIAQCFLGKYILNFWKWFSWLAIMIKATSQLLQVLWGALLIADVETCQQPRPWLSQTV